MAATPRRRQCGSMEAHERLSELYSSFRTNQNRIESFTARSITSGLAATRRSAARSRSRWSCTSCPRRPRRTSPTRRSRARSRCSTRTSARRTPTRPTRPRCGAAWSADANIQFALATKDPKGKATTGITRTATTRTSFGADDSVKTKAGGGAPAWPAGRYLNLWVCNLARRARSGTRRSRADPPTTDGVVILHSRLRHVGTAAAPFNLGRTATHEIGHWLNLRHIWGDENDSAGPTMSRTPRTRSCRTTVAHVPAPQLRERPERRHVHELHGLRRRRRDGDVHAGADHADERRARGTAFEDRTLATPDAEG